MGTSGALTGEVFSGLLEGRQRKETLSMEGKVR